jgi:hypothetical protein
MRRRTVALLLALVLTTPLVILLIGMPIVLCLRAVIEIVGRFWLVSCRSVAECR